MREKMHSRYMTVLKYYEKAMKVISNLDVPNIKNTRMTADIYAGRVEGGAAYANQWIDAVSRKCGVTWTRHWWAKVLLFLSPYRHEWRQFFGQFNACAADIIGTMQQYYDEADEKTFLPAKKLGF